MKKHFYLTIVLSLIICLGCISVVSAENTSGCGEGLSWSLSGDTLRIWGNGAISDFNYYQAPWYNSIDSDIKHIVIEDGVTRIGAYAFWYCTAATDISIPNSVTSIGDFAFAQCKSLKNVSLPSNLYALGSYIFSESGLESITIPGSVKDFGGNSGCSFMGSNHLRTVIFEEGCKEIKKSSFSDCQSLEFVSLPDTLEKIDMLAFRGCINLREVKMPKNLKIIEPSAFIMCYKLDGIVLPEGIESLGYEAFCECSSLSSINIPKSLVSLEEDSICYCDSLKFITVDPDNPYFCSENDNALYDKGKTELYLYAPMSEAKTYDMPSTVVRVNYPIAFYNVSNLETVNLSSKLDAMGASETSRSIKSYNIPSDNKYYTAENGILYSKDKKELIAYPCGKTTGTYTIPSGVERIANYAFSGCMAESINLPDTITETGMFIFYRSNIKSAVFPGSCKVLHDAPFYGCSMLETVVIGEGVTDMDTAFWECTSLKNVTLPFTLIRMNGNNFWGCSSIESIYIPNNVLWYGEYEFYDCSSLKDVHMSSNSRYHIDSFIDGRVFQDCTSLEKIVLPADETVIPYGMFDGCVSLKEVVLPERLITIEGKAFSQCKSLEYINIPDSVETIMVDAFEECESLKSMILPSSLKTLEGYIWLHSPLIETIEFKGDAPENIDPQFLAGINRNNRDQKLPQYPEVKIIYHDGAKGFDRGIWTEKRIREILQKQGSYTVPSFSLLDSDNSNSFGLYFELNSENKTASVIGSKYSTKEVMIPATVTKNNIVYTVNDIAEDAFDNYPETIIFVSDIQLRTKAESYGFIALSPSEKATMNLILPDDKSEIAGEENFNGLYIDVRYSKGGYITNAFSVNFDHDALGIVDAVVEYKDQGLPYRFLRMYYSYNNFSLIYCNGPSENSLQFIITYDSNGKMMGIYETLVYYLNSCGNYIDLTDVGSYSVFEFDKTMFTPIVI